MVRNVASSWMCKAGLVTVPEQMDSSLCCDLDTGSCETREPIATQHFRENRRGSSNPILCPHLLVRLSHSQTLGNRYVVGKCRLVKIHVWESEILIKKKTSHHHLKSNRREPRVTYFSDSLNCTLLYQKRDIILVITVINVMG